MKKDNSGKISDQKQTELSNEIDALKRQLEIEAALERVRASTMGMKKSEDLVEVATILYHQLLKLSYDQIAESSIVIFDQPNNQQVVWTGKKNTDSLEMSTLPLVGDHVLQSMFDAWDKKESFFAIKVGGTELENHKEFVLPKAHRTKEEERALAEMPDPTNFNCAFFSKGYLELITADEINKATESILCRFAKVFDQTYTRFLDLKKAEEQAREAQVEVALERVRSRSMGMHQSHELKDVIQTVYEQLVHLNIHVEHAGFIIDYQASDDMNIWLADQRGVPSQLTIPYFDSAHWNSFLEAKKKGINFFANRLDYKEKNSFYKKLFKHIPSLPEETKKFYFDCKGLAISTVLLDNIGLYVENFSGVPYTDKENTIVMRFGRVFQQTYTRFLDLKKAEEQAREAQIEAALERVRSRTMGMQHSEELQDASMLLFQQIEVLDIPVFACGFNIWDPDKKAATAWMAGKDRLQPAFKTSSAEDIFKRIHKAAQKGESLFVEEQRDEALRVHYQYMNSIPEFKEIVDKMAALGQSFPTFQVIHCAYFAQGYLMFISFEPVPQVYDIFIRFAKVFEQTYTRFLDLKKAEQQAREAQIEVALERVRARTMAMHKGDELAETAILLFEQITELGIKPRGCGFLIMNEATNSMEDWSANINEKGKATLVTGTLAFDQHPILSEVVATWKNRKPYYIGEIHGKELQKYYKAVTSKESTSQSIQNKVLSKYTSEWTNSFYFEFGMMYVLTPYAISKEEIDMLLRFASVFKLTYRRFLDLKKAEDQAREAEIELALERVRARTMALQHSDELADASFLLVQQVKGLGIETWGCAFNIWDENSNSATEWFSNDEGILTTYTQKRAGIFKKYYDIGKRGETLHIEEFAGQKCKKHYEYMCSLPVVGEALAELQAKGMPLPTYQLDHVAYFRYGYVLFVTYKPIPEAHDIFKRFAKVFEQTYIRFLDLRKAEEQAREAQIEAALERIRNRTLLMRDSSELNEAVAVFFQQFQTLGLLPDEARTYFCNIDPGTDTAEVWMTRSDGTVMSGSHHTPLTKSASMRQYYEAWKQGQPIMERVYTGKALKDYLKFVSSLPHVKKDRDYRKIFRSPPKRIVMTDANFLQGNIGTMTFEPLSQEAIEVLQRFAKVFEFTYTRFLDLKKAEEQAREAQIEAALERVRAASMAMHHSRELSSVAGVLINQLDSLGLRMDSNMLHEFVDDSGDFHFWAAAVDLDYTNAQRIHLPYINHSFYSKFRKARKQGLPILVSSITRREKDRFFEHFYKYDVQIPKKRREYIATTPGMCSTTAFGKYTAITVNNYSKIPYTEEENKIITRFSQVFEQSYTRFLDLKKAEEQALEAQIEAALERIRARALAMHSSEELMEVADVMREQMSLLGQPQLQTAAIHLYPEEGDVFESWLSLHPKDKSGKIITMTTTFKKEETKLGREMLAKYRSDAQEYTMHVRGKPFEEWRQMARVRNPSLIEYWGDKIPDQLYWHFTDFSGGSFVMVSHHPPTEETKVLQRRLTATFDLAYRRFQDLKQAEKQAREAQIEAALERVRASTMAMHSSDDLVSATTVLFQQLEHLGIVTIRCGVLIINDNQSMEVYTASTFTGDTIVNIAGVVDMTIHPLLSQLYENWKSGKRVFTYELKGKDAERYYGALKKLPSYELPQVREVQEEHVCTCFLFKEGALFAFSRDFLTDESTQIFQKFTNVFTLTYRRYLDLKEAEARASAAVLKSSLDRVRAEIASMRTKEDLQRITPLVWRELQSLGVPFFRCGVFIMDESTQTVHMYLSTPTGDPLATVNLGFDEKEIPLVRDAIDNWNAQTVHKTHWNREQFRRFTESLKNRGLIKSLKTYQQGEKPPKSLYLHQVPFKQGMLYVGSSDALPDDQIELVHSLADAFSVAYSRYEDFVQLEEAKKRVENTLNELKSAQNQLIHSEKMASLGELTAGIAHEIQNPLNFVNNFSEVSEELLEEMKEEIEAGHQEDALEIVQDLIQNLEKINHHGQRASSIVKGMLQHSRASSDEKQLTDINALVDEYLRLAYHGFRAKDKSFNANFKTELADDLPKINIVPQDIGRVILNLVNNGFQAVKDVENPEVVVTTRRGPKGIQISVKDNGPGIPEEIKDKIFQPFFTTKATGEGTGLGLSLSYDIVTKGHGGTIGVESNGKKGTEFTVSLPVSTTQ